jgi:hypothetical protein
MCFFEGRLRGPEKIALTQPADFCNKIGPKRRSPTWRLVHSRWKPTSCPLPAEAGERRFGARQLDITGDAMRFQQLLDLT